ncbi:MAG: exodeoxyribonuclease III [Rhodospirillaceae bacterium]|nr:exodeoxyribonuclease III [Rhodospirillaceae bacterium]
MKIATWNVNSIKARLPNVLDWLKEASPDVVLLQEIKCVDEAFPELEIGDLGYNVAVHGQKTYNGVAILAKRPIEDVQRGLPGDDTDVEARYIEAVVGDIRVASVYVPNGQSVDSDRFAYKLGFFGRLRDRIGGLLDQEEAMVIGGDYNVAPAPEDVYDPDRLDGTVCYHPDERAAWRQIVHLGVTDAFRALHREPGRYSWWDYRGRGFETGQGYRIDHLLLSPQAVDRLDDADIDIAPRSQPKASDHTPVWCAIAE